MRYTKKTRVMDLKEKYDCIIGWGVGGEFKKYYRGGGFLNYIVDTGEKGKNKLGKYINGLKVYGEDEIKNLVHLSESILVVIYPNIEPEILKSIAASFPKSVDTIVARLLDYGDWERSYSTSWEDHIILEALKMLRLEQISYMDVGVCHPVVRNNTYLFYENGNTNGVLVEPNVEMCKLAEIYRPENKVVNCGASSENKEETELELTYYYDNNNPGLNTFSKEVAERRNMLFNAIKVPVRNINTIIEENFETYPNILDLDTEGMDYDILKTINFEKYPIDIICAETGGNIKFNELLAKYQYRIYAETWENTIFIKEKTRYE